jgi:tight adherence protein B
MIDLADPLLWAALAFLAITAGLGMMVYNMLYGARARMARRIKDVATTSPGHAKAASRDLPADVQMRRKMVSGKLKELDATRRQKTKRTLRLTILQAGLSLSVGHFFGLSAAAAALVAVAAFVVSAPLAAIVGLSIIAGVGLPRFVLSFLVKRRIAKFTASFADAIDIITRGIRSGLPVSETFNIIVQEMPDPLGIEFRTVVESQRLGLTLEEALSRACERVPTSELKFFSIVLSIQQTTGGNLAETLAKLSDVLRARKRMRDKIQAMSGEAKASAMIIGSLPPLVGLLLAVVAPQYVGILLTNPVGHVILFAGASIMGVGVFVMRQMINFDI